MIYVLTSHPLYKGVQALSQRAEQLGIELTATGPRDFRSTDVVFAYQAHREDRLCLRDTPARVVNGDRLDKITQYTRLAAAGLPVPDWRWVSNRREFKQASQVLGLPLILKPNVGGYGHGVRYARSFSSLLAPRSKRAKIAQQYIECGGRCIRALVVGERVVAVKDRVARDGRIASYSGGRRATLEPAELTASESELCIRACQVLQLEVGGVDLVRSKDGPFLLEVNHHAVPLHVESVYGDSPGFVVRYLAELQEGVRGHGSSLRSPQEPEAPSQHLRSPVPAPTPVLEAVKPKVLWISDKPGWSYDAVFNGIRRELEAEFTFETRFTQLGGSLDDIDPERYLHIHLAPWFWTLRHEGRALPSWKTSTTISSYQSWQSHGVRHTTRWLNERYAGTVFITQSLHELFHGVERRWYLRNGVDTRLFTPPELADHGHGEELERREGISAYPARVDVPSRFVVGWVGNPWMQGKRKQFFQLIRPALEAMPEVELITAMGRYPYREIIPHAEMPKFYARCDAYLHAAGGRLDTAPCPVLEAAACGIPVITCPVGDWHGELRDGDNALLIEPTMTSIQSAVRRLINDGELRSHLARQGREFALENAWSKRAHGYRALFRSTMDCVKSAPSPSHLPRRIQRGVRPVAHWPA